jgi:predicted phage-related endonuclease
VSVEILTPASRAEWLELRLPTIGASESPAMLGVHPYMTPFTLWAKKSGALVSSDADNKQMRRGRLIEPVAIDILRDERPEWAVTENIIGAVGKFYRDLETGLSCTPDAFVVNNGHALPDGLGVCQIKTVNPHTFKNDWTIDGEIQLPVYVAIQAMQEACLTGASWACVLAIVGFDLDAYIIDVPMHAGVIDRIKRAAKDFLRRVRENDPPPPDYARDSETITAIYDEDDGGMTSLVGLGDEQYEHVLELVARREECKAFEEAGAVSVRQRKVIDAELIHMLGNASRGMLADGRVIEAKTVRRKGFVVEPTTFRTVKIKGPSNERSISRDRTQQAAAPEYF